MQCRGLHPRGDVHVVGADVFLQGGPETRPLGARHRDEVLNGHGVEDLPAESCSDQSGAQRLAGGVDGSRCPCRAAPNDQDLEGILRVKSLSDASAGPGIEAGDEIGDIHATLAEQLPVLVDRGYRLDAERLHFVLEGAALDRHMADPRVEDAHGVEGLNHGRAVLACQGHVGDEFSPLKLAHRLGGFLVQAGGVAADLDQGEHQRRELVSHGQSREPDLHLGAGAPDCEGGGAGVGFLDDAHEGAESCDLAEEFTHPGGGGGVIE